MPARQSIPVNGGVLRWARDLLGYSIPKAAAEIGVEPRELTALEAGQRSVNLGLLDRIARAYKQTRSALLRASPPEADPRPRDFRSERSAEISATEDVLLIVRSVRRIQRAMADLLEVDPELFPRAVINTYTLGDETEDVAVQERRALGFKLDVPPRADAAQVYASRRILLERQGILVFQKKWPRREGIGISLFDPGCPPSIVVNTDQQPHQARSFTLFHEFAHLLLRQPGVSDQQVRSGPHGQVEQWCNRVAAAMLMPRTALLAEVETRHAGLPPQQWGLSHIGAIARRFRVSYMAAGIRLKHCGVTDAIDRLGHLLRQSDTAAVSQASDPSRPFRQSAGRARFYEVGPEVAEAFLKALETEVIDTREASAILDLNSNALRAFAETAQSGSARSPAA